MTILLVLIILYMYAIGAFLFFREVYILQSNGHYCNSMPQCFVTILHHGLVGTAYEVYTKFNTFPNNPLFLYSCTAILLKTLWEKEKLLVTSNFFFSHSVFYPFRKLSAIFIKFKIVVCKLF